MNSICKNSFDSYKKDPKTATTLWHKLINLARYQASHQDWHQALISYGNALDIAEITFADAPVSAEVNRYIRTASELAYTIRQSDHPCELSLLVSVISNKLKAHLYPADITLLVRPLTDISSAPLVDVHRWMQALFESDNYC